MGAEILGKVGPNMDVAYSEIRPTSLHGAQVGHKSDAAPLLGDSDTWRALPAILYLFPCSELSSVSNNRGRAGRRRNEVRELNKTLIKERSQHLLFIVEANVVCGNICFIVTKLN